MANSKYTEMEDSKRGMKIRTDFGPDRFEGDAYNTQEARHGRLKGDVGNIDPMIRNGKVPTD